MLPYPYFIITAIIAFNITAFTVLLQLDWMIFHSVFVKTIAWALTITAWGFVYLNRNR
ncbi:MAG TPA: hypothetical protein VFF41_01280 [Gallionella sp.]|nr:hypothetical protein [Gallionella sp.]